MLPESVVLHFVRLYVVFIAYHWGYFEKLLFVLDGIFEIIKIFGSKMCFKNFIKTYNSSKYFTRCCLSQLLVLYVALSNDQERQTRVCRNIQLIYKIKERNAYISHILIVK